MIGSKIGKCEILSEIGRGGMGIVYKGHQESLDRDIAIKMLPPQMSLDKEAVARFKKEARAIAKLQHENIVQIFEIEEQDGEHFILMEFLDGVSLDRVVRDKAIPVEREELISFLIQVCDALECTHKNGIIHRDVKTANIFITWDKKVKLMDFGISKTTQGTLLTTGVSMGTPSYMSPEHAKGETLDPRSDIYSLGVVLYECLTGRLPFIGEDGFSVALKHISQEPTQPRILDDTISKHLNRCCMVALAKDKTKRFANCQDFALALRGFWPDYLAMKEPRSEKMGETLASIFNNHMFVPGITTISILLAFLTYQQVTQENALNHALNMFPQKPRVVEKTPKQIQSHRRYPIEKNPISETPIPEFTKKQNKQDEVQISTISHTDGVTVTTTTTAAAALAKTPLPSISDEDTAILSMAIDSNQFDKAEQIFLDLKAKFPNDKQLSLWALRLEMQRETVSLFKETQSLMEARQFKSAEARLWKLKEKRPKDEIINQQMTIWMAQLEHVKIRQEKMKALLILKEQSNFRKLASEARKFNVDFQDDPEGRAILTEAESVLQKAKWDEQKQEITKNTERFLEEKNLNQALKTLHEGLRQDEKDVYFLRLQNKIIRLMSEEKKASELKGEEKNIDDRLQKLLVAFSEKNLAGYLDLLDGSSKHFYENEKDSFEHLTDLAIEIESSLTLLQISINSETEAKASVFWKTAAIFAEENNFRVLWSGQVEIAFRKDGDQWKIKQFVWVG